MPEVDDELGLSAIAQRAAAAQASDRFDGATALYAAMLGEEMAAGAAAGAPFPSTHPASDDDVKSSQEDLQRFVENAGFDWRVFVINNKAVARMQRHGKHWINNVAQGASCTASPADAGLDALAEASAAALSLDYAGVDLVRDSRGRLQVIEVNSIPAWKGLQSTCEIDIARQLVDDFHARYLMPNAIKVVGT